MKYRYVLYVQSTGEKIPGEIEAESLKQAEDSLWQEDRTILSIAPVADSPQAASAGPSALHAALPTLFRVRRDEVLLFTRHLAALMASGMSELEALQVLREQTSGPLAGVLDGLISEIAKGTSLSDAVAMQGAVFPDFYTRLLRVGETSGTMAVVLRQLALYMEQEEGLKSRVQRAMAYPIFIFAMSIVVVAIILTFALPALTNLYAQFSAQLPWPTRLLIAITSFARTNGLLLLLIVLVAGVALAFFARTPGGGEIVDGAILRLPFVGSITVRSLIARYTRALAVLLRAGLQHTEVMDLLEDTVGNRVARRALSGVHGAVQTGTHLDDALRAQTLFPPMVAQMVSVGEKTGKLAESLDAIADLYEDETDRAIRAMTGVLEPAMTIFMGLIVAFIALSTILPIYGILKQIR